MENPQLNSSRIPRPTPTRIEPHNDQAMLVEWSSGERYSVPYTEVRYFCPCAGCVDEHTGQRTIQRTSIQSGVRPNDVRLVGRYAVQIGFTDQHDTGIYPFDRLFEICQKAGERLN